MLENVAFYEDSEERLKEELAGVTAKSTLFGALFDSKGTQMVEFQGKLAAKEATIE